MESRGYFPTKPAAWGVCGRRPATYRLVWIEDGAGWLETALTRRIAVPTHSFLLLFPGRVHSYAPDVWWSERWLEFAGPIPEQLEAAGFLDPRQPVLELGIDRALTQQFLRVEQALREPGPLAGPLAAARLHEVLILMHCARTGLRKGDRSSLVQRALDWIDGRLPGVGRPPVESDAATGQPIPLVPGDEAPPAPDTLRPEDVAQALDVGYSTLRRRFKRATGFSVKEYILSAQLRRAKQLLTCTSESVEVISRRLGFEDPFYFSRLFRSREGASPSAFRERREQGPSEVVVVRRARPSLGEADPR